LEYSRDEETFAQNIIAYQVAELKRGILNLKLDTKEYEKKYGMSSAVFYEKFQQGQMDDSEETLMWAGCVRCWKKMKNNFWGWKDD
jgi:hypothetical protein